MDEPSQKSNLLPVTIVTGFLGSGKTTLLNHILSRQQGVRTAVLVNEFGKIGIDQELIVSQEDGIIELSNGCICCTINSDLLESVAGILERRDTIDYLIVETTGIADPYSIALTFVGRDLSPYIRLDSILTLADAENLSEEMLSEPAAYQQIKYGDIILLNKCDLANENRLKRCEEIIRNVKPKARILRTERASIALSLILDVGVFESEILQGDQTRPEHSHTFTSLSFEYRRPIDVKKLQDFLGNKLPETVYRAKGILWLDINDKRNVFHVTGRRFTIDQTEWGHHEKKNQMVFIGHGLEKSRIEQDLAECLIMDEVSQSN